MALVTMDDSTVRNVQKPLDFIRSRSCGDISTFDPAFDDVMRRALEKHSYAKRFKPLIRELALLSFARNLLLCTALAVQIMRALSDNEDENHEWEHRKKGARRPSLLLMLLLITQVAGLTHSLLDLSMAVLLWYRVRQMRGQWFLSAVNPWENTQISVGCYETDQLKVRLDVYFLSTILATAYMVMAMAIVQFYYPGFLLALWRHFVNALWHDYTVDTAGCDLLLATLPCIGLALLGLDTAWQCRQAILPFRQLFWAEVQNVSGFDMSSIVGRLHWISYALSHRLCYVLVDLVDWSVLWVGYVVLVLLRRKEVFCVND
ncbi:uncharacterized protein LOC129590834 [Paramacrobiotus metropolitanus]|uniref:uncharacterized protein LOC129590834 n=1 Tax=Paramacrobiotus metropolitanus TaxID=2943436 RepID=UPI002445A4E6|nr:uncharacterized protein LOC129590834 [Paramacrobiotus metropolitanus]